MVFSNIKSWTETKRVFAKIALNRIALIFLLLSLVHCLGEIIIHSSLFSINSGYSTVTTSIVNAAQVPQKEFAWLSQNHGNLTLRICDHIPEGRLPNTCETVFQSGVQIGAELQVNFKRAFMVLEKSPSHPNFGTPLPPSINPTHTLVRTGTNGTVDVSHDGWNTVNNLSNQCTRVFVYANEVLNFTKRENFVFVAAQVWLLVVSFIAVMSDSTSHTLAVICARVLTTGWSAFAIWRTLNIKGQFEQMIFSPNTPCNVNIYPAYFRTRLGYEISDLTLGSSALVLAIFLGRRLVKEYRKDSFVCLGPPKEIVRIYKLFAVLQVCLQLSLFLLLTTMGLWIDQLASGAIAKISSLRPVLLALFVSMTLLSLPWIATGWYALRHEMKKTMISFLGIAFVLTSGLAAMFGTTVFRWMFIQWPLLSSITVSSFVLLAVAFTSGVICWMNFGEGLSQYLYVEEKLASSDRDLKLPTHSSQRNQPRDSWIPQPFEVSFPSRR